MTIPKARGTAALKTYLQYAETGDIDVASESDRGFDSEFERQVAKSLASLGFDVRSQIGDAGFFVDLAVVDPVHPGRYLIGIECDGASYHSSRSARDRDKIRQSILEDRGWIIHRIWSTDWFQRPEEQLKLVASAIEFAKAEWGRRDAGQDAFAPFAPVVEARDLSRDVEIKLPERVAVEAVPYKEANFSCSTTQEIHELPADQLGSVVLSVLKVESPVHRSEVARRIAQIWGLSRTGRRITEAVEDAIRHLQRTSQLEIEKDFVSHSGFKLHIRSREFVVSANLKKPEILPPAEIAFALKKVIESNIGIAREEAIKEVGRLLGFRSTSAKLKNAIDPVLKELCEREGFEIRGKGIYVT